MSARPIQPPLPGLVVSRGAFEYTLVDGGDNIHGVISARFGESPPISFVLRKNWDSEVLSRCLRIKALPAPQPGMRVRIQGTGLGAVYATMETCDWYTGGNSIVLRTDEGDTIRVSPHRWTPEFMVVTNLPTIADSAPEPTDPPIMTDPIYQRYLKCSQAIWRMFEENPLPSDDPAHTMLERLEALIRHRLIQPAPHPEPACPHGLILADGTCSKCHSVIDPVGVASARTKGAFQSAGTAPTLPPDLGSTPRQLVANLAAAIDGIERSAIDANRRAGHNARERDELRSCLDEATALLADTDRNINAPAWWARRQTLSERIRKATNG